MLSPLTSLAVYLPAEYFVLYKVLFFVLVSQLPPQWLGLTVTLESGFLPLFLLSRSLPSTLTAHPPVDNVNSSGHGVPTWNLALVIPRPPVLQIPAALSHLQVWVQPVFLTVTFTFLNPLPQLAFLCFDSLAWTSTWQHLFYKAFPDICPTLFHIAFTFCSPLSVWCDVLCSAVLSELFFSFSFAAVAVRQGLTL